jgi:8-oxo-dGTP pyrophosphatase MutT (NUDIX family)
VTAWFETTDVRVVYEGRSTVRLETVRMPDGEQVEREVVDHDDAVAVLPVTDDGEVILLKQYRQPVRGYVLEVPAGVVDDGDPSPEATARRELAEEIQHDAGTLVHLVTFHNSAGWTTERTHVYLARDLEPVGHPEGFAPEHEEADMEVLRLSAEDAVTLARNGELSDAKTALALLLAAPHLALGPA